MTRLRRTQKSGAVEAPNGKRLALPPHAPGLRIGLLGGSFNPAHAAHRAISLFAMKRLQLDRVWWLVSPGNPLKDTRDLPPISKRLIEAKAIANHPRIDITDIEAVIGSPYTYDTLNYLVRRLPRVHLVWLMGADSLTTFSRWRNWRGIADLAPLAIIDRAPLSLRASQSTASQALNGFRIPERLAAKLADASPPAWVLLHGLKLPLSSTAIRKAVHNNVGTKPGRG